MAEEKANPETPEKASQTPSPQAQAPAAGKAGTASSAGSAAATQAAPSAGRGGPRGGGPRGGGYGQGGGRGGRGGPPRGRGRPGSRDETESEFEERVVKINRCATVVKGGRRFSFSALVVLGDRKGSVGVGFGKANEVPPSVEKAVKDAKKSFVKVSLKGHTIPHRIVGQYRTSKVVLVPAVEGTGIIAGAAVRAVVECVGIQDVLTKVFGSANPLNVVKATLEGLKQLRTAEEVARLRGVEVRQ